MFDLSLAHIHSTERERDLVADLRDRRILKFAAEEASPDVASRRPSPTPRPATRSRAYVR